MIIIKLSKTKLRVINILTILDLEYFKIKYCIQLLT